MRKIYIASSWKNEGLVKILAKVFRAWGHGVYCFAEQGAGQHIFDWGNVVTPDDDGITCLDTDDSRRAFKVDKEGLDWSDTCILLNPCGRDAHLEAGYSVGQGKELYILGPWPKGEYSNMYHLAHGLIRLEPCGLRYLQELLEKTPALAQAQSITPDGGSQ